MQLIYATVLALATAASAAPSPTREQRAVPTYDASNPPQIFTNATCTLSQTLTQGEPLQFLFPLADHLGALVSPLLDAALSNATVNDLDQVADDLCVDAQQEPEDGNGICQDAFQAISDFVDAKAGQAAADKYRCLLNLLCVAHTSPKDTGTCQYLLAGVDCVANRIIGVHQECE